MVKLKNDRLEIDIANHGAEVKRVYHLDYELDYLLWTAGQICSIFWRGCKQRTNL